MNKVIALARDTGYVKNVVSYVKLAGEPVEGSNVSALQPIPLDKTYQEQSPIVKSDTSYQAQPLDNNYQTIQTYPDTPSDYQDDYQDDYQNDYQGDYQNEYPYAP